MTWSVVQHCTEDPESKVKRTHPCPWRYARWKYPKNPDGTASVWQRAFRTGLAANTFIQQHPTGPPAAVDPKRGANQ